jgi:hypothetical protein
VSEMSQPTEEVAPCQDEEGQPDVPHGARRGERLVGDAGAVCEVIEELIKTRTIFPEART